MRARTPLWLGLSALASGAVVVVAGLLAPAPEPGRALVPGEAPGAGTTARPEPAAAEAADPAAAEPAYELAEVAAARRRALGWVPPEEDALLALRGRVVDAHSERGVAGIRLSLLSPRPRTVTVVTDAHGRFETAAELAAGVISAVHDADPQDLRFQARWELEPSQFLLRPGAAGEVVLRAKTPEVVLEVELRLADGTPAALAEVSLTAGRRDPRGAFQPEGRDYEVADDAGRARFALFGDAVQEQTFELEAALGAGHASDVLMLDPPLAARPQRLDLHPAGTIRVSVRNDEQKPVAGVPVRVAAHEGARLFSARHALTDGEGFAEFAALRAGCYTVDAIHPLTGESVLREVDLARGAHAALDLPLSVEGLELAVSGAVVDEQDRPLPGVGVRVQPAGRPAVSVASDAAGRFECWSRRAGGVTVAVGAGFLDDLFEPAFEAVRFGTSGVVLRRRVELDRHSLPFVAVDRERGLPIGRARITLWHGASGAEPGSPAQHSFTAADGVAQVAFKLREDTRWAVDAPGYLRAQGSLSELCETYAERAALRVELERGFERTFRVLDRVTRQPVSGAAFVEGARSLGESGADGVLRVREPEWPARLRVERAGYEPRSLDPAAEPFPGEVVWLEPARARRP